MESSPFITTLPGLPRMHNSSILVYTNSLDDRGERWVMRIAVEEVQEVADGQLTESMEM